MTLLSWRSFPDEEWLGHHILGTLFERELVCWSVQDGSIPPRLCFLFHGGRVAVANRAGADGVLVFGAGVDCSRSQLQA